MDAITKPNQTMHIPQLQMSKAKYEASKLMKKYEQNGEGVILSAFNDNARGSTQINTNREMATKKLKPNDDVAHKLSSNAQLKSNNQIRGKAQVPIKRVYDTKASNMQFSREQIKEIFQYYDSDRDGFLNIREVTKAFALLGSIFPFNKAYHGMASNY
ncbi:hypothetical protein Csa_018399 [Cucumis sativus]|nr:hypothetical protein Csa_018399 [Cucumis sativus]